ncbi:MAG: hypothetical protein PHS44_04890 [Candidatus Dojkabacteria bacterium]|jgi:hypothetical protein|nr:hypothetical protein [Candidatus Dojkabacteria bacterium]
MEHEYGPQDTLAVAIDRHFTVRDAIVAGLVAQGLSVIPNGILGNMTYQLLSEVPSNFALGIQEARVILSSHLLITSMCVIAGVTYSVIRSQPGFKEFDQKTTEKTRNLLTRIKDRSQALLTRIRTKLNI